VCRIITDILFQIIFHYFFARFDLGEILCDERETYCDAVGHRQSTPCPAAEAAAAAAAAAGN
jgi:hypothetical protein